MMDGIGWVDSMLFPVSSSPKIVFTTFNPNHFESPLADLIVSSPSHPFIFCLVEQEWNLLFHHKPTILLFVDFD